MPSKQDKAARAAELLDEAIASTLLVLRNPDSPATARASAASTAVALHRILMPDDIGEKEPSEMTYDELQASINQLQREEADA